MNPIINNPFRTLGLLSNSKEREIQKQISIIRRYSDIGKLKSFDYDFRFFGDIKRSPEDVINASNKIEQSKNKIHHSLFWFVLISNIDEIAINHLKDGNIEKAKEIWSKSIKELNITDKNHSSISNITTLNLGLLTRNGSMNLKEFAENIKLKSKLLSSNSFKDFILKIGGDRISIDIEEIEKEFINNIISLIKPYLDKQGGVSTIEFINSFDNFPNSVKSAIQTKFTSSQISNVEKQIDLTRNSRNNKEKDDADVLGEMLFKKTQQDIIFLKSVLTERNLQYQILANNLANEILQCSIDYFIKYKEDDNHDPGDKALRLMKMAGSVVCNGTTKSRIIENVDNIQKWIEDKPQREKISEVKSDLDFLTKTISEAENLLSNIKPEINYSVRGYMLNNISLNKYTELILKAKDFIISCKPYLDNIEDKLGRNDIVFLNISTTVGFFTEQIIITVLNSFIDYIGKAPAFLLREKHNEIKGIVRNTLFVNYLVGYLKLDNNIIHSHKSNSSSIEGIAKKLEIYTTAVQSEAKSVFDGISKKRNKEIKKQQKEIHSIDKINTSRKDSKTGVSKGVGIIMTVFWVFLGAIIGLLIDYNSRFETSFTIMSMVIGGLIGMLIGYIFKKYS